MMQLGPTSFLDRATVFARAMWDEVASAESRAIWRESIGETWPLAARRLGRDKLRAVLLMLCVAVSVAIYLLFASFRDATTARAIAGASRLALPADMVVMAPKLSAEQVNLIDRAPQIKQLEAAHWLSTLTSAGRTTVVGLPPQSTNAAAFGTLVSGKMPAVAGEIALPEGLARATAVTTGAASASGSTALALGARFRVSQVNAAGELKSMEFAVVGVFRPASELSNVVLTVGSDLAAISGAGPNALLAKFQEGSYAIYPSEVKTRVLAVAPDAQVYFVDTPQEMMGKLVVGVLSPANLALILVFGLSGLGILNLQLLSFLRRKRDIGVLRALGMDAREAGMLLYLEGLALAVAGIIIGEAAAVYAAARLSPGMPFNLAITTGSMMLGAFYSLAVFTAATWLPVTLSSRATVDQLLHNRRVYLNPNLSCAQCGRCGGF